MFGNKYNINVEFEEVTDDVAVSFPYITIYSTDELENAEAFLRFVKTYYPEIEEPDKSDFFDVFISIIDSEDDDAINGYLVRAYENRDKAFEDWKVIFSKLLEVRYEFKLE